MSMSSFSSRNQPSLISGTFGWKMIMAHITLSKMFFCHSPFIIKWMRNQLGYSIRPTGSTSTLPFAQQWLRPHLTKWPLLRTKLTTISTHWSTQLLVPSLKSFPPKPSNGTRLVCTPFDPDIHPDRIRFGEVTDILGKVNTRKACGPDHIINTIIRYLIPKLHIILQDLLDICVFHGYHPWAWKRAWALKAHKPSKRRSDSCS